MENGAKGRGLSLDLPDVGGKRGSPKSIHELIGQVNLKTPKQWQGNRTRRRC